VSWDGSSLSDPSSGHVAGEAFNFGPNYCNNQFLPIRVQAHLRPVLRARRAYANWR
jgi:hypothetical protein